MQKSSHSAWRLSETTIVGALFLAWSVLGYALSVIYHLTTCIEPGACATAARDSGLAVAFSLGGTGLEGPLLLQPVFILGLVLTARKWRWAILGDVLVGTFAAVWIGGSELEPVVRWAFTSSFGIGLFLEVSYIVAGGLVVLAAKDLINRWRNRKETGQD